MKNEINVTSKATMHYLIATIFCALFGGVYEIFSHGVFSFYMIYAFAFPLALGVLPCLVLNMSHTGIPSFTARFIYASGITTLTIGSLVCGVLEIYGTTNPLTDIYWIAGIILYLSGTITGILQILRKSKNMS